ncbi:Hypothetical protein PBC10988_31890 [Planctomycetales bacterium 10988]|nr:Hypothetical protein PBC10988_31890 [Planctomycetales bacterium 10988]
MAWLSFFSHRNERHQQALLKQLKETPLQLESLEQRCLLTSDPFIIDINQIGSPSEIEELTEVNGTLFFSANDGTYGRELWKSDGTSAGTQIVKIFSPANDTTNLRRLTNVNGTLFFSANDGVHGSELWMSNGFSEGTVLVKDIDPAIEVGFGPQQLTNVNGTLFFTISDGVSGHELWMSDGTSTGTQLVNDTTPGRGGSPHFEFTNVNGSLFFVTNDGSVGYELWVSDGTSSGTQLVKDIYPGKAFSSVENLANVNGTLFFTADDGSTGEELWISDGTSYGTQLVRDIRAGNSNASPANLFNLNGTLFFSAYDDEHGRELWISDGTSTGTQLVKNIDYTSASSSPRYLTNVNGILYFNGREQLWKSDGTSEGTQLVTDIRSTIYPPPFNSPLSPKHLTEVNGTLFFQANGGTTGVELWMSDGTSTGTVLVKDIFSGEHGSNPFRLTNVNGNLFFRANNRTSEEELWRSDGTSDGTNLVRDINITGTIGSNPKKFIEVGSLSYFIASTTDAGEELWVSDGTQGGTRLVKDIRPGSVGSSPRDLTNVEGTLFFQARDRSHGYELWMSDGTLEGTQLVKEILPSSNSLLSSFTEVSGNLFFLANDGSTGTELWISNGTENGTILVKDLHAGRVGGYPQFLTNVNGTLFFVASDGSSGTEVWKSDGTSVGTQLLKDLEFGILSSNPEYLVNVNGTLFFEAFEELWISDGTSEGTNFLKDIEIGSFSPRYLTNVNGTLFFSAYKSGEGRELWMSDSTSAGTQPVKDIRLGSSSSSPRELMNVNGTLFFWASIDRDDDDLWMSDGTSAGTQRFTDFLGNRFSNPTEVKNVNRTLFFRASDGSNGEELWMSNGTEAGTQLVKDIRLGSSSNPKYLTNANGTLFFQANDGLHGTEVWVLEDTEAPTLEITPDGGATNGSPITFTFQFSEFVFNFEDFDIIVTGGAKGSFTTIDQDTFTLGVLPLTEGLITVSVADDAAEDFVGNLSASAMASIEYDTTAPTPTVTPDNLLTNNPSILFTIQFDEEVFDFAANDVMVINGSKGTFTAVDGDTYTLQVTAGVDGDVIVNVAANGAMDAAGNGNAASSATVTYDGTAPTLDITPDAIATNDNPITFTFEFSEDVVGFTIDDIAVIGGSKGTLMMIDGNTYTLDVTPSGEGNLIVAVEDGFAADAAGNSLVGDGVIVEYDSIAPTLTITPDGLVTNLNSTIFTFQFSEAVTGFTIDDVFLSNGTKGVFTPVDGDTYELEVFSPCSSDDIIIAVLDDAADDAAGNGNIGDSATITFDNIAPTLEITPDGIATNQGMTTFTFQFSEGVTGFTADDVTFGGDVNTFGFVSKGTFTAVDEDTYTLEVFYSNANGDLIIEVADDAAVDEATNGNTGDSATITYDNVAPTLEITPDGTATNQGSTVFTFQFSEGVTGFMIDDVDLMSSGPNISTGTLTAVDEDTYTLEVFHSNGNGDVIVSVSADEAFDAAGNGNTSDSATITFDDIAPTLMITPENISTNENPITFTFEFSEEIFEFVEGDIVITGGVSSNFTMVDGDTYTIDVTPDADGDITVTVADDAAEDEAGNLLLGDMATIEYDGTAPTLEITPDGGESNNDPIIFTFLFSEDVTGFDSSDIMVVGGTAGTFTTVDDHLYTLEVTPDEEDGDVTVTVADGVAQDAAMNDNVGDSATVTFNATEPTPLIVTGTDAGGPATVRVFDPSGNELLSFMPYGAFTGGVRVATGDINGDGILDIITAAGPGGGPHVQVFDSETGQLITGGLNNFYAYAPNVTTGVFVAVGDVNNDGYDDIITAPDAGGGPHLKVYDGLTGDVITEFYAYAPNVTVGVRIATGDINGDGFAEIITTPGPGGGPHVRVINGMTGEQMPGPVTNFYAYAPNVLTGLYVASGDVNGDGFDDIITSPGAGGGPHVQAFSSADGSTLQNFYAYHPAFVGGVRVGSADLNQDGFEDIITVPGSSGGPHTRAFSGVDLADLSNFFSGSPTNTDGLLIAGGISFLPVEDPFTMTAQFSRQLTSDSVDNLNTLKSDTSDTIENVNADTFKPKKSWYDEVDEFYQSSEKIDKLFSGLGIDSAVS